jgi:predicted  nucleic acid-binding Zn-ribbon protein
MNARHLFLATWIVALLVLPYLGIMAHAEKPYQGPEPVMGEEEIKKLNEIMSSDKVSQETKTCLSCHIQYTPGIVYQWLNSAHAQHPAKDAAEIYKAIGAEEWIDKISPKFKDYDKVVGCYECHGMYADKNRPDVVNHFGYNIVTVVTRKDCGQCHPKEDAEISWTWHATGTLHATFLPWYKGILTYAAKKLGANPFGNETAKKLYEEYFPPYLTKTRDKDPIYWSFYEKIAKAVYDYFNGKATDEDMKIINMLKEATGMITPYDLDFKKWISPVWPASGVLNTTVLARDNIEIAVTAIGQKTETITNPMSHPWFRNAYIYHACGECHGTVVVPYKAETTNVKGLQVSRMLYWGWPSNGAARVDPDGSTGTCTACHTRHMFSLKQAREPQTCGQCHLGYDHPHIEIYEESKHGNIEKAYGEHWNWERLPWRVGVDFNAPSCAACHMSTLSVVDQNGNEKIVVKGTHDFLNRIVWNEMHFFAAPKPITPDKPQEGLFLHYNVLKGDMAAVMKAHQQLEKEGAPVKWPVFTGLEISEGYKPGEFGFPRMLNIKFNGELAKHREEMKKVCELCHSAQWTDNYFRTADQNMVDYDIVAHLAFNLLQLAWKLGIHDKKNIHDEYMEIMWYYIWHHDGRRWRNGAFMMGPDYAHWYGIVDTVMDKLGRMIAYLDTALKVKALQMEIEALKKQAGGAPYQPGLATQIAQLQQQLQILQQQLEALQAQVPALAEKLSKLETDFSQSTMQTQESIAEVKESVQQLLAEIKQLAEQLPAGPQKEAIQKMLADMEQTLNKIQALQAQVQKAASSAEEAKKAAEEAKETASAAHEKATELSKEVKDLRSSVEGMAKAAFTLGIIAIVIALAAAVVAVMYKRK